MKLMIQSDLKPIKREWITYMEHAYWIIGVEEPRVLDGDDPAEFGNTDIVVMDDHIMVIEEGVYKRKNGDVRDELHKAIDRLLLDVTHYWDEQIEESLTRK